MKRVLAVAAVLVSVSVFAQTEKPTPPVIDDRGRDHKFRGNDVEGGLKGPAGDIIYETPKHHFKSMVKVRANFQPELEKSADAVK